MQIAISPQPLTHIPNPATLYPGFTVNPQADGTETYTVPDAVIKALSLTRGFDDKGQPIPSQSGDVLSVQPDGRWETRAEGTAGPFEKAARDGAITTFWPIPGVQPFPYAAVRLPNA